MNVSPMKLIRTRLRNLANQRYWNIMLRNSLSALLCVGSFPASCDLDMIKAFFACMSKNQ